MMFGTLGASANKGSSIYPHIIVVTAAASGQVGRLRTTLSGVGTWSKVSGQKRVGVTEDGTVILQSALDDTPSVQFIARVANGDGDAVERRVTVMRLTVEAAPVP